MQSELQFATEVICASWQVMGWVGCKSRHLIFSTQHFPSILVVDSSSHSDIHTPMDEVSSKDERIETDFPSTRKQEGGTIEICSVHSLVTDDQQKDRNTRDFRA